MTRSNDILARTDALLAARDDRPADLALENRALLTLADQMADRPGDVLQALCDVALEVFGADSAGVSLLTEDGPQGDFRWPAIAGAWGPFVGGGMPRDASPCGAVLEQDHVLVVRDPVTEFPALAAASPDIVEAMLAPFHVEGRPIGTVWVIAHDDRRVFDQEDQRMLINLARFAAAAYRTQQAVQAAKTAQEQLDLANQELGHRLKNMLTMVGGIAAQTLRATGDRSAVDSLLERLQALGAAQDILINGGMDAAPLRDVAQGVMAGVALGDRVFIDGPDVTLGPKAALALALSLHELSTNAIKYGALSDKNGTAHLSWNREGAGRQEALVVRWREQGGPPVSPPTRKGFGSRLLSMGLTGDGGTTLDFQPDGFRAEFRAPLSDALRT